MEKTRRRGVEQSDWIGVEQEERRGQRIADQSDQSIADWSNQSRMDQASRNEENRVERSEQILKERNQICMRKRLLVEWKWSAATETASPGFLRAQIRDSGRINGGVYDDDGVGDAGKSNTTLEDV